MMLLDEVADLGAQADTTVATVEDHSWQLGELSVMMQMMQEMMETQQERLMEVRSELLQWSQCLVAQETQVNERLLWLQSRVEAMDVDEEVEGETLVDEEEEMTTESCGPRLGLGGLWVTGVEADLGEAWEYGRLGQLASSDQGGTVG